MQTKKATASASSNIAFIKYWGKKDEENIIPMNTSVSMTLRDSVSTTTTVTFSSQFPKDTLMLNGKKEGGKKLEKVSQFLDIIRKKFAVHEHAAVESQNSFPTGCGIASSASGFAALAMASVEALGITLGKKELSALARRGSGSACRSVYTGFVTWSGSFAEQIYEKRHWPELRDVIVVIDAEEKKMSSRDAMKRTVETSDAYKKRLTVVDDRVEVVKQAIGQKDFPLLAKTIMEDSDEFHACLKDTKPRVTYLTEKSYTIIDAVRRMNADQIIAGYTFDAGPNAHLITLEEHVESVVQNIKACIGDVSIIIG